MDLARSADISKGSDQLVDMHLVKLLKCCKKSIIPHTVSLPALGVLLKIKKLVFDLFVLFNEVASLSIFFRNFVRSVSKYAKQIVLKSEMSLEI